MTIRIRKLRQPEPALLELPPDDDAATSPDVPGEADAADLGGAARSSGDSAPASASGLTGLPGALSEEDFDDDVIGWQVACEEAEAEGRPPPPRPAPKPQPEPASEGAGEIQVVENERGGRNYVTPDGSKWALGGIAAPTSVNAIGVRYFDNGRITINLTVDGRLRLEPGDTISRALGDPIRSLVEPTLADALEYFRRNEPPELDAARKHYRDLESINIEKLDIDAEEEELRARRRRLTAPGVVRGKVHEVVALDKRLTEIADRRETLRLEKVEIDKHFDVLRRALAERIRPVLERCGHNAEQSVRGDLLFAQNRVLKAVAPALSELIRAHTLWRNAANLREAFSSKKDNVERVLSELLAPIQDGSEERTAEQILAQYAASEAAKGA